MSDQKKNIPEDRFQTVPNVRPFTKYRAAELAVCGVCVLLGEIGRAHV